MPDRISKEERSRNMSNIRGKDTSIEVEVRKYLFSQGFRFRKNDKRYPGKPDIVLPKYRTVVFVNGCFWHRHVNCKLAYMPKSNIEFWNLKFEKNIANDEIKKEKLKSMGFRVIDVWECEIKKEKEKTFENLKKELLKGNEEETGQ